MILALLLAAVQAQPAPAPAPSAAPASAPLSQATATRLLGLVFPVDGVIAEHRRAHQQALAEQFASDAKLKAAVAQDAGFRPALEREVDEQVNGTYRRLTPALQAEVTGIYRRTLTEAEGTELVAIFSSPTGRKLVAAMHRGTAESDSLTPSGIGDDGRRNALAALGQEDRPTLERIARQPALMGKMREAAGPIREASNRFIERCTAELAAALPKAVEQVSARFAKGS